MRKGYNPNKDSKIDETKYNHQVIIPVYIPKLESYFRDALKILSICIDSIIKTSHKRTFITLVNNGSCKAIVEYLNKLLKEKKVHEIVHTTNIGKINAAIKGASGHNMPLVTIADADVLFLSNWQRETVNIFNNFKKAGVVGLVPQFFSYQYNCENFLFNKFLNKNIRFRKIKNPEAMVKFYHSLGWDDNYPKERLDYSLCLKGKNGEFAYLGTGHFVSTFKREILNKADFKSNFKMGGDSESNLDKLPSQLGYITLTTYDNYAYHMGNVWEPWMEEELDKADLGDTMPSLRLGYSPRTPSKLEWKIKKKLMGFFFKKFKLRMIFLGLTGLPRQIREHF